MLMMITVSQIQMSSIRRSETVDTDADGIGNNADTDDDNDGVADVDDAFPLDASESLDTDADGIGNNTDTDDDNDGAADTEDAFPLDASESWTMDGIGNSADADDETMVSQIQMMLFHSTLQTQWIRMPMVSVITPILMMIMMVLQM